MDRETALSVIFAVLVVSGGSVAPVAASSASSTTPTAANGVAGFAGYTVPSEAETLNGTPQWIVHTSDESKLADWASQSDSRQLVENQSESDVVVVAAPASEVVHSTLDAALADVGAAPQALSAMAHVDAVHLDVHVPEPQPVSDLKSESEISPPDLPLQGSPSQQGVATSGDIQQSTLGDARGVIGADNVTADGSGVTVAVVDTGVNTAGGKLYGSRIKAARNTITDESGIGNVTDKVGHGSWVASSIAANASNDSYDGVAPGANLLIAKALNKDGGSTHDVAEAIRWSERNGADVISLSLGSPIYSPEITRAIREAVAGNVTSVVVATGNSRQTVRFVSSPADAPVPGVVSVGATNVSAPSSAGSAYFSQIGPDSGALDMSKGVTYGQTVTIGAPGTEIEAQVASTDGSVTTSTLSGTSMATPLVSGSIAVALDARPSWVGDTATVKSWIEESARRVPGAGTTEVGHGMIAVDRMVDKTETSKSQAEVRNPGAVARDEANEALGVGWVGDAQRVLGGAA